MKNLSRGLLAALLASGVLAAPAYAVNATVRVEGENGTLLERTPVSVTQTGNFGPEDCPWQSPGGAIEVATGGNWDRLRYTKLVLGERHDYAQDGDYWAFWINNDFSETEGVCDRPLREGDEILLYPDPGSSEAPYVGRYPLGIQGVPPSAREGQEVVMTVVRYDTEGRATPQNGATVTISDGRSTISDQNGQIRVRFAAGDHRLKARGSAFAPSASESICVTTGADGRCGSATPGTVFTRDVVPPRALISNPPDGRRYRRGRGPRELRGVARDAAGIRMVKLRMTRSFRGRCHAFSATLERLIPRRCGIRNASWFRVSEREAWTYQLPGVLPRGRYVLDVNAIDRNYNRDDQRRRGQNRVVFYVGV